MGNFLTETRISFFTLTKRIPVVRYENIDSIFQENKMLHLHCVQQIHEASVTKLWSYLMRNF